MPISERVKDYALQRFMKVRAVMMQTYDLPHLKYSGKFIGENIIPPHVQEAVAIVNGFIANDITGTTSHVSLNWSVKDTITVELKFYFNSKDHGPFMFPENMELINLPETAFRADLIQFAEDLFMMYRKTAKARNALSAIMHFAQTPRQIKAYWPRFPTLFNAHSDIPVNVPGALKTMIGKWDSLKPDFKVDTWPEWREDIAVLDETVAMFAMLPRTDLDSPAQTYHVNGAQAGATYSVGFNDYTVGATGDKEFNTRVKQGANNGATPPVGLFL